MKQCNLVIMKTLIRTNENVKGNDVEIGGDASHPMCIQQSKYFSKMINHLGFSFQNLGGEVAFVDYSKGDAKGHVRLSVEGSGKTLFAKLEDGKVRSTAQTPRILQSNRLFPLVFSSKSMILRPLPNCWRAMRKSHI